MKITTHTFLHLIVIASVGGCGSAYKTALKSAKNAEKERRFVDALVSYEQACAFSGKGPNDKACIAARNAKGPAVDETYAKYQPICNEGDPKACVGGLHQLPLSIRTYPALVALRDLGGSRYADTCNEATSLASAVRRVRCLENLAQMMDTKEYNQRLNRERSEVGSRFVSAAEGVKKSLPGAKLVLLRAGQFYDATGVDDRIAAAQSTFLKSTRIRITAATQLRTPRGTKNFDECRTVGETLGYRVLCGTEGEPYAAILTTGELEERRWKSNHDVQYIAETREVENPDYRAAIKRERQARRELSKTRRRSKDAAAQCRRKRKRVADFARSGNRDGEVKAEAEASAACQFADNAERDRSDAASVVDQAESDRFNTPETVTEDVYDTHYWTSHHYEWSLPYELTVAGFGDPISRGDVVRVEKMEQEGFPPAEVPSVSLGTIPTYAALQGEARATGVAALIEMSGRSLSGRAGQREKDCPADGKKRSADWLQCRAEVTLWRGEPVDGGVVLSGIR